MCGMASIGRFAAVGAGRWPERRRAGGAHGGCGGPLGFVARDAAGLAPADQVRAALTVLAPAALGTALLLSLAPGATWIVFAFGWMLFPVVGLLGRGLSGVARGTDWTEVIGRLRGPSVAAEAEATVVQIGAAARLVPAAVRERAMGVYAAAQRVRDALAAADPATARWAVDRYLAPTAVLLDRYVRLAGERDVAAEPTLTDVETRGLPLLEAKLDALAEQLRGGDASVASESVVPAVAPMAAGSDRLGFPAR